MGDCTATTLLREECERKKAKREKSTSSWGVHKCSTVRRRRRMKGFAWRSPLLRKILTQDSAEELEALRK